MVLVHHNEIISASPRYILMGVGRIYIGYKHLD
jgi:hypothetical protein